MDDLIYDTLSGKWYTEEEFEFLWVMADPIEYEIDLWLRSEETNKKSL